MRTVPIYIVSRCATSPTQPALAAALRVARSNGPLLRRKFRAREASRRSSGDRKLACARSPRLRSAAVKEHALPINHRQLQELAVGKPLYLPFRNAQE